MVFMPDTVPDNYRPIHVLAVFHSTGALNANNVIVLLLLQRAA
jgi:hypothetical protein